MYLKLFYILVAALFLLTPLFNNITHVFPEKRPRGERISEDLPPFNLEQLQAGKLQKGLEELARKQSPFWLPSIKLQTELYFRLFNQTGAFANRARVLLASEGHLFRSLLLPQLNRTQFYKDEVIRDKLTKLKRLQDNLEKRGTRLLFVITPNLTSLYPELIPSRFTLAGRDKRQDLYLIFKSLLKEFQIKNVDTNALLLENKNKYPFRFFARSASHWNEIGSCLSLRKINDTLWQSGKGLRQFNCEKWHYERIPRNKDRDLARGLNLLFPKAFFDPTPYVDVTFTAPKPITKPRVLAVGTSYLCALVEHILTWKLADETTIYFNYRRVKERGWHGFYTLKKEKIDWARILSSDIIIVSAGMRELDKVGYGFVEDALSAGKNLGWW